MTVSFMMLDRLVANVIEREANTEPPQGGLKL